MNIDLLTKLREASFTPLNIDCLSDKELLDSDTFEYLFSIEDILHREQLRLELEKKAKKEGCLTNFKRALSQYEKALTPEKTTSTKPKHNEIADKLAENNPIALYNDTLYVYEDGVYKCDRYSIERKIAQMVPEADSRFRNEVYKDLELKSNKAEIQKESGVINFKNGLFSLDTLSLSKHTPEFFCINQLPVSYNPEAVPVPEVDDFFEKISSGNEKRKQAIFEMIGYCMTTSVKLQKSFILYGETARNGKSTLCNVITALLGQDNISTISLRDMGKNTFATSGIFGKLLNIGSEMTEEFLSDVSIFKMFATGDSLSIEHKHKDKQTISPYAKFIFNANVLPVVSDKTNGFYRRLQIIPLETSFTEADSKKFDIQKILTPEALEYLAQTSIIAYASMLNNFSNYEESDKIVAEYKQNANSVISFLKDKESNPLYDETLESIPTAKEVYIKYKDYCIANQYYAIGRNKFYQEVEKSGLVSITFPNNQKVYSLNS